MPIVTVECADHSSLPELLTRLADAIMLVLDLGSGDVLARSVTTSPGVASAVSRRTSDAGRRDAGGYADWVVVTIHGSDRGQAAIAAARVACTRVVANWSGANHVAIGGVWTEWVSASPLIYENDGGAAVASAG